MTTLLLSLPLTKKRDLVLARQRARQIAGLLGFDTLQQTAIATAVFEIAAGAFETSRHRSLRFQLEADRFQVLTVGDEPHLKERQRPNAGYQTAPGQRNDDRKWDIDRTRRLLKRLRVVSNAQNRKLDQPLPAFPPKLAREDLPWLVAELNRLTPLNLFEEIRQENLELARALRELEARQAKPALFVPGLESPAA